MVPFGTGEMWQTSPVYFDMPRTQVRDQRIPWSCSDLTHSTRLFCSPLSDSRLSKQRHLDWEVPSDMQGKVDCWWLDERARGSLRIHDRRCAWNHQSLGLSWSAREQLTSRLSQLLSLLILPDIWGNCILKKSPWCHWRCDEVEESKKWRSRVRHGRCH